MKIKPLIKLLVFFALTITSCVKNVDFDQVDNIELIPIVKASLVHFDVTASDFEFSSFTTDIADFHLFDSNVVQDDVTKIELIFEIENSFNKDFNIIFSFLNDENEIVSVINLLSSSNTNLNEIIIFENQALENLLSAKAIIVSVNLIENSNITTPQMNLNFKSAADVYFKINVNEE